MNTALPVDIDELDYAPSRFVQRDELSDVLEILRSRVSGERDVRVVPIECESGTGKSWLLRHLAEVGLTPHNHRAISVGHALEHHLETSSVHSLYVNLADWLDKDHPESPSDPDESARRLLASIIRQVDAWSEGQQSALETSLADADLDECSRQLEDSVRRLVRGKVSTQRLLVLLVDHVYESPWEFLRVLDSSLFGPLSSFSRVVIVTAGRGRDFPWQSPDMWLQRSKPIRLGPLNLEQTRLLLAHMEPPSAEKAEDVFSFSDGYPRRSYLIARYGRAKGIELEVAMLLSPVPSVHRPQLQAYLEALCVLAVFDEDGIPRLLKVYNDFAAAHSGVAATVDAQATTVRDDLVDYGYAVWSDDYRGWVIDRVVQTAIMDNMFENRKARLLVALEKNAHDLYLERERRYPATADLWHRLALEIREGSLSSGWRIPQPVGRKYMEALRAIETAVNSTVTTIVYVTGMGGMGKTRLLEEAIKQWKGKRTSDGRTVSVVREPIDLYHVETQNTDMLMETIKESLSGEEDLNFGQYTTTQKRYEETSSNESSARERRGLRTELRKRFIDCLNMRQSRLVLAFDTAESLDYGVNRDVVKKLAISSDEQYGISSWLFESCLPNLKGAVVLVAGRKNRADLEKTLRQIPHTTYVAVNLDWQKGGDSDAKVEFVSEYFRQAADSLHNLSRKGTRFAANAHRVRAWTEAWMDNPQALENFAQLTGGNPILLGLTIDYLITTDEWQPSQLKQLQRPTRRTIGRLLARACVSPEKTAGTAIRALGYLRKGADAELLLEVMKAQAPTNFSVAQAEASLESLKELTFIKHRPADQRVFLHDVLYDLLEEYILIEDRVGADEHAASWTTAQEVYTVIQEHYRRRVKSNSEALAADPTNRLLVRKSHRDLVEKLYYDLHRALHFQDNPLKGFDVFYEMADSAVQKEDTGEGLLVNLNSELRMWQREHKDKLPKAILDADDGVRWVKWFIASDRWDRAVDVIRRVEAQLIPKVTTGAYRRLFETELAVRKCEAYALQMHLEEAELSFRAAKAYMDSASPDATRPQATVLAYAHTNYGYLRRLQGRHYLAIEAYSYAVALWRALDNYVEQSNSLNNLAFAHGEMGDFGTARRQAHDAWELRKSAANYPLQALSLTTLAQISIREGLYITARRQAEEAIDLSRKTTRDERGLGLALVALAEAQRRQATEGPHGSGEDSPSRLLQQAVDSAQEACGIFDLIRESQRRIEALIQLGCAYRDRMNYLGDPEITKHETSGEDTINELFREGMDAFQKAESQAENGRIFFLAIDACNRLAWQHYYRGNHFRKNNVEDEAQKQRDEAHKWLAKSYQLVEQHYPGYSRLGYLEGELASDLENLIVPLVAQIGKAEVLRGQMRFGEFLDARKQGQRAAAHEALAKAIRHYTLSLNTDSVIQYQFRDKRRAHDRIYDQLKDLNMQEWAEVLEILAELQRRKDDTIPVTEMHRFIKENFGQIQWAHSMFRGDRSAR